MSFAEVASTGPLIAGIGVALLAGLVSFASPCTLPLMPGYVSYVTGLSGSDLAEGGRRGRILAGSLLFIAGFSAVYIASIFALTTFGRAVAYNQSMLETVGGVFMIVMGVLFIGLVPLGRGFQPKLRPTAGLVGAPVFGAVFALSWIPCTSPVLAAIMGLAVVQDGAGRGVALMAAYCLGIGLPFVVFALGMHKLAGAFDVLKRHARAISIAGGAMLIVVGLLLVTGGWNDFLIWLRSSFGTGEVWL
jgi:cytochrome c-type biogenesis protein